jgi:tripartite motif-containing protein 2/3
MYTCLLTVQQDEMLKELEEIHTANELAIMEMANNTEKTTERIDDSCKFTERILEHGNGVEVLSLKKLITHQLLTLLNNVPRLEPTVKIEFETDFDAFSTAVKSTFGHFKKPEPKKVENFKDCLAGSGCKQLISCQVG